MNTNTPTLIAGLLWMVALWRLPSVRHSHKQRSLTLTLASLAAAMTFEVPAVKEAVADTIPVDGLAPLLKHLLGVASAALLLDFVIAVVRPQGLARRLRTRAVAVTLPLMIVTYAAANWMGPSVRIGEGPRAFYPALYMAIFTLYVGVAMIVATWLFAGGIRHSRSGLGKAGLGLLALGTMLGSLYALQRVVFVTIHLAAGIENPELEDLLSTTLKQLAILAIVLGVCLPPMSVAVEYIRAWETLRQLRPLWQRLTESAPYVVLSAPIATRRVPLRLERCIIEIEDACLALREYVSVDVHDRALAFVREGGGDPSESDAIAEACWLHEAARCARNGNQVSGVEYPALGVTGRDRASEIEWLKAVARAYLRSEVPAEFSRQEQSHGH
ncbi:MAB_1171c family putative transporter [Streptomyces sp. NPDC092952]|uniref:MAB_1171c family putative transporter n=1 Tax=Streptomyces sp. NPDC092952 TaxID=3366018 RepID=UPI00381439CC